MKCIQHVTSTHRRRGYAHATDIKPWSRPEERLNKFDCNRSAPEGKASNGFYSSKDTTTRRIRAVGAGRRFPDTLRHLQQFLAH